MPCEIADMIAAARKDEVLDRDDRHGELTVT